MEGLECCKGPNIMGLYLVQPLSIVILKLLTQKHGLFDPGRNTDRNNVPIEVLPKEDKNQLFTLSDVLGFVQTNIFGFFKCLVGATVAEW